MILSFYHNYVLKCNKNKILNEAMHFHLCIDLFTSISCLYFLLISLSLSLHIYVSSGLYAGLLSINLSFYLSLSLYLFIHVYLTYFFIGVVQNKDLYISVVLCNLKKCLKFFSTCAGFLQMFFEDTRNQRRNLFFNKVKI